MPPINESFLIVIFAILFGMVLIWFLLIKMMFNRLESYHPEKYKAMGRPSLFGAIALPVLLPCLNFWQLVSTNISTIVTYPSYLTPCSFSS